ncbi:MAG: EFR1 family ferrodoxin [Acutalibacteraceae bacterium]
MLRLCQSLGTASRKLVSGGNCHDFIFSGTGNSRHVAERIAQTTGDAIENIAVHLREGTTGTYQSTVPYVFVGPVYAGRYPKVMTEFMEKSTFGGNKKAYFIATCAETPWITETYTRKLAAKIGFEVLGFNSVIMPQSYTTSGAAKPDEENNKIVAAAEPKIAEIAEMIQNGVTPQVPQPMHSGVVWNFFVLIMVMCIIGLIALDMADLPSASFCASVCPLGNIEMKDGHPVWGKNCTQCLIEKIPVIQWPGLF